MRSVTLADVTYGERGRKDDVFGRAAQRAYCDDGFHWDGQDLIGAKKEVLSECKSDIQLEAASDKKT